ncbi:GNAT family N-acetyltransferase [Acinetobacter rathckeae]|uniref:GNAT family N-acetyltransferase n=1 Tax=Acinetobacter rathckeae TaxID=2605272 RepID=UPI0018A25CBE|nr:GNAT family N-acetyltransferase [Acinetobacter rathckeae]MBF7688082.1 GNAT family N-acetyltransferase [Acinetobacter rathckeae]MBF7695406.1 GNAT family N-acetyltransferase [Acinetobacter rathckeae]
MILRNNVEIIAEQVVLRVFTEHDAEEAFDAITPNLAKFMSWEPPKDLYDFEKVWRAWADHLKKGSEIVFAVRDRKDNEFLGLVGLHRILIDPRIGVWIKEKRHSQGYGTAAVQALMEWASLELEVDQFTYLVADENLASQKIAIALGGIKNGYTLCSKYNAQIYKIMFPAKRVCA